SSRWRRYSARFVDDGVAFCLYRAQLLCPFRFLQSSKRAQLAAIKTATVDKGIAITKKTQYTRALDGKSPLMLRKLAVNDRGTKTKAKYVIRVTSRASFIAFLLC